MKKLIMLSLIGLMSTGVFANNGKIEIKTSQKLKMFEDYPAGYYTFSCSNGNSATVYYGGGTVSQIWSFGIDLCVRISAPKEPHMAGPE